MDNCWGLAGSDPFCFSAKSSVIRVAEKYIDNCWGPAGSDSFSFSAKPSLEPERSLVVLILNLIDRLAYHVFITDR